jgi:hypothetical protein
MLSIWCALQWISQNSIDVKYTDIKEYFWVVSPYIASVIDTTGNKCIVCL